MMKLLEIILLAYPFEQLHLTPPFSQLHQSTKLHKLLDLILC